MKQDFIKTQVDIDFYPKIMEMNDRELQEYQAMQLYQIKKNSERIANNIQFFFWLTIASILLAVLTLVK